MPRIHQNFNRNWQFMLNDDPSYSRPDYDDSRWRTLKLPHDWSSDYPPDEKSHSGSGGGYAVAGIGWYRKDTYYYFRSVWNKDDLTLHIVPHWNWSGDEGEYKQVLVYTNCDAVELYINGRKVGRKSCGAPLYGAARSWNERRSAGITTNDLHLSFDVVYEPGTLRAVGYKNGEIAMETVVQTTGEAAALRAEADRSVIRTDGVAHIDISAVDAEGRPVPTAAPVIRCEVVSGPGRLVGMEDMYDLTLHSAPERRMFSGWLMAMICADEPGDIRVKISSGGMEPVYLDLKAED